MLRVFSIIWMSLFVRWCLPGQNCLALKNLDILNVARHIDPAKIDNVVIRQNTIVANAGFKFVQLRDTETFILVPESFQSRFIDFQELAIPSDHGRFVIDSERFTAKVVCQSGVDPRQKCKHERINRTEVGCAQCPAVKWISASVLSEVAIIIPPYRLKS